MSLNEFALIKQFFTACGAKRADCLLGIGDDAAILQMPNNQDLVVTQDTLVAGVHFIPDTDPTALGHKALAVNLSDLAAMGAEPAWFTLGLTMPKVDTEWLEAFTDGLCTLAQATGVQLIGGDTTSGPLAISITVLGRVPSAQALRRSGAKIGDRIYVSGTLGDAGLALLGLTHGDIISTAVRERLERPTPRLGLGRALRGIATAAIDISDGLVADLGHILAKSCVGAEVRLADIPYSPALVSYLEQGGDLLLAITAGDDYELCFTLPPEHADELTAIESQLRCPVTWIGDISNKPELRLLGADGCIVRPQWHGYDHFHGHE